MPISEPFRGSRRPKNRMTRNETKGIAGISQALRRKNSASALNDVDVGEVDALLVAVDQEHDRQADADLGCRHCDHEQGEDLPGDVVVEGAECDQVDVDGGEDELDRHENEHTVPTCQYAVDTGREQERAEEEELVQVHVNPSEPRRSSRPGRPTAAPTRPRRARRTTGRSTRRSTAWCARRWRCGRS